VQPTGGRDTSVPAGVDLSRVNLGLQQVCIDDGADLHQANIQGAVFGELSSSRRSRRWPCSPTMALRTPAATTREAVGGVQHRGACCGVARLLRGV
jgi:hypothetical protein